MRLALSAVVALAVVGGCSGSAGDEDSETFEPPSASQLRRLALDDTPPSSLAEVCQKAETKSRTAVVCPPIAPRGLSTSQGVGDFDPEDPSAYDVQMQSATLHREARDSRNPGHWSFGAAGTLTTLEEGLRRPVRSYDCQPDALEEGEHCGIETRTIEVGGVQATEYSMPPYPFGGVDGGHLVFLWQGDDRAYKLSVHDPANRPRALLMLEALVGATG